MAKPKRVPRRVGHDSDEETASDSLAASDQAEPTSSVVKRPLTAKQQKAKKSSALRTSFAAPLHDDDESTTFKPRNKSASSSLARHVLDRNVSRRDDTDDDNRPSYSASYLAELKNATPTLPRQNVEADPELDTDPMVVDTEETTATDSSPAPSTTPRTVTHIPTAAEIREKKDRRRRAAAEASAEQDFIALDDDAGADETLSYVEDPRQRALIQKANKISLYERSGAREGSRLVREDEDMAEGFDEFVQDEKNPALVGKASREQDKRIEKERKQQILESQTGYGYAGDGLEDEEEGDEEHEEAMRNNAFNAAQMRAGGYEVGVGRHRKMEKEREMTLPKTRPIPDFKTVLARFQDQLKLKEQELEVTKKRLERVRKEKEEIKQDEARVQELIVEAQQKYEELQRKADEEKAEKEFEPNGSDAGPGANSMQEWGLESIGGIAFSDTRGASPPERVFEGMAGIPDEDY